MTVLTDSIAREHADSLLAGAAASRRAREARRLRRSQAPHGVRRAAVRPFSAVRAWLVAGQL